MNCSFPNNDCPVLIQSGHAKAARFSFAGPKRKVLMEMSILVPLIHQQVMKLKVIIHPAEEGGYWAEVPAIPGCVTQGETREELLINVHEAIEGCLSVELDSEQEEGSEVVELAL